MSDNANQLCPICGAGVTPSQRYPHYLCRGCAQRASDSSGRALQFFNESFSGGYIAKYADNGDAYDSHVCFIDGVECWADEDYFGGIVIRRLKDFQPRRV